MIALDIHEARKNLVFILSEIVRIAPIRYREYQQRRLERIEEIGKEIKKLPALKRDQNRVRDDYINKLDLTKTQSDNLHMFSSPLRIPEGLTREQVNICIHLYDLMYPTGSALSGSYEELGKAILYFEAEFPNDSFTAYLKGVLQAKLRVQGDLKRSDDFWKRIEALPKEQREVFNAYMRKILGFARDMGKKCDEHTG